MNKVYTYCHNTETILQDYVCGRGCVIQNKAVVSHLGII